MCVASRAVALWACLFGTTVLAACAGHSAAPHTNDVAQGGSSGDQGESSCTPTAAIGGTGGARAVAPACTVTAPSTCPDPAPRYSDVQPIFEQHCVTCHFESQTGPWPLTDYAHVASWQDTIRAELLSCSMPPPESGCRLPKAASELILSWIRCGLPQ